MIVVNRSGGLGPFRGPGAPRALRGSLAASESLNAVWLPFRSKRLRDAVRIEEVLQCHLARSRPGSLSRTSPNTCSGSMSNDEKVDLARKIVPCSGKALCRSRKAFVLSRPDKDGHALTAARQFHRFARSHLPNELPELTARFCHRVTLDHRIGHLFQQCGPVCETLAGQ